MKKASLQEIVDSLEIQFDEQLQFLDRQTGEVHLVSREDLRAAEEYPSEDDDDEPDIVTAIAFDRERFPRLPTAFDIHEWEIMREFAEQVEPERLRHDLLNAIHGSGAFRYFKDTLRRYRRENDWHAYKTAALREIAIDGCKENDIEYEDDLRRRR